MLKETTILLHNYSPVIRVPSGWAGASCSSQPMKLAHQLATSSEREPSFIADKMQCILIESRARNFALIHA